MNLIGNKYEWTIKISIFILGYYFVWQLLSYFIQACHVTAGLAVVVSVPSCYELGYKHFSSMFRNKYYVSTDHTYRRCWKFFPQACRHIISQSHQVMIAKFETLHPECFLSHLQCEDSLYTLYPLTCPTNKTCMGSSVTNEETTILFMTRHAQK